MISKYVQSEEAETVLEFHLFGHFAYTDVISFCIYVTSDLHSEKIINISILLMIMIFACTTNDTRNWLMSET